MKRIALGMLFVCLLLGAAAMEAVAQEKKIVVLACRDDGVGGGAMNVWSCSKSSDVTVPCPTVWPASCAQTLADFLNSGLYIRSTTSTGDMWSGIVYTLRGRPGNDPVPPPNQ